VIETRTVTQTVTTTDTVTVPKDVPVYPQVPAAAHVPSKHPAVKLTQFSAPGRNVACALNGAEARCDIANRIWSPPAAPKSCNLDWGQGLEVGPTGDSQFVCAGDSVLDPSATVVSDGTDVTDGTVTCQVRVVGVTCFEPDGRGFVISRTGYATF
jgi:hypothetical protein